MLQKEPQRSYQLEVMKLFFAAMVFLSHTNTFIGENTTFVIPHAAGVWAVFFFFIVSGMLMVNSRMCQDAETHSPAEAASVYVTKRLKRLLNPYWSALFLNYVVFRVFILLRGENLYLVDSIKVITQVLFLSATSLDSFLLNSPAWYISAMLIVMLPFYYLLTKSKDTYLYIFAPLTAILLYVWCFQREGHYFVFYEYYGLFSGGLVLAAMGLSFGAVSWIIAEKLNRTEQNRTEQNRTERVLVTVVELILYGIIFVVWFSPNCGAESAYSVMLLLPIAVGISFSQMSYVSCLFRTAPLKKLAPVSLAVYLNHICAWRIVNELFLGRSYRFCLLAMILFTAAICPVYFLVMRVSHYLWKKFKSYG